MNTEVCVSLNPEAERFAPIVAGDLIINQGAVSEATFHHRI